MSPAELLLLGAAIGINNLAVSLALGAMGAADRRWRIAAVFGVFEFTVPLVGLLIGREIAEVGSEAGRVIGAALLAGLGGWTLRSASDPSAGARLIGRVASIGGLAGLAAGLSLDNLLVGFGLGLGDAEPVLVATVIAAFSITFTLVGLELGAEGRRQWERQANLLAGFALIGVAIAVGTGWLG